MEFPPVPGEIDSYLLEERKQSKYYRHFYVDISIRR